MTAPLKSVESATDIAGLMHDIGRRAKDAARRLALAPTAQKDKALAAMAAAIRARAADILAANAADVAEAKGSGATAAFLDRLALDDRRIAAMAEGLDVVRALPDPVGTVMERWTRPNGMVIERVRVPLGVVGIIYESRPNVTADAAALCLKAGNAAILRGGSESYRSNRAIHAALIEGLGAASLPEAAIALVPTRDRAAVGMMLAGLDGATRRHRAARRQESGRARAGGGARAGVRPPRGHLPRLCGQGGRARHGAGDPAQRQDAAHRRLRRGRDAARRPRGRADAPQAARHHAARRRLRSARRRGYARGRSTREAGERGGLVDRISRRHHLRQGGRRRGRGDQRISSASVRTTPTRS